MATIEIPFYSPTVHIILLLRSWCSPERVDQTTMAHVQLDKTALNNLMRCHRNRIKELESEIDAISRTLDKYHSLIAPIRRLSPEILLSIFSNLVSLPGQLPRNDDAPWVLTRVCSTWRDLAIDMPTLWSKIRMECFNGWWTIPRTAEQPSIADLLAASLRYSKKAPLDITLSSHHPASGIPLLVPETVLLGQQSNRWRSLVTNSGVYMPQDLPALERLEVYMYETNLRGMQPSRLRALHAPRLHTLIFNAYHPIPFSRFPSLRHCVCVVRDSEELVTILEDAQQLTSLCVKYMGRLNHKTLPSSGITSNLLELYLPTNVPKILSYVSFPLLHSLTIGLPSHKRPGYKMMPVDIPNNLDFPRLSKLTMNNYVDIPFLKKFLSYSITHLALDIDTQDVYDVLASTPLLHLEDLRIIDMSSSEKLKIVRMVKTKKTLRNLELVLAAPESVKELFWSNRSDFPQGLTMTFAQGYKR
ncbi:hypothetical protein EDD18DRAFT_1182899 [Armillaria luteobubalina]|uniref:F-box domain-containing protein n=1 Tax=Armillaria luteobubalina TaxID=153913 RepID=A0AA39UQ29_9AGAR|nr:hypothetical protein EDD18DRAFT_1182899 [Armillaria luteobubalina]